MNELLESRLVEIVGRDHVLSHPSTTASYGHDLTGRYRSTPLLVVLPKDAAEVSAVIRICAAEAVPLVPQGGNTGLVGGAAGASDEVVLSLSRFDDIGSIDPLTRQVTVGAGVTLERLQERARSCALDFPVDHGARSSATIGGMAATNAGGALAARYGSMRAHVVGLEAITATGGIICRLSGLIKDNAGYDLSSLLVGSEGTLAVITRVRVRLVDLLPRRAALLVALDDMAEALDLLPKLNRLASVQAVDFFDQACLDAVCARRGMELPFDHSTGIYLIVEFAGRDDSMGEVEEVAYLLEDALVADDSVGRARLWSYREALNETIAALGVPHKLDVSVPPGQLPEFTARVQDVVDGVAPSARVFLFGHLADGNVHVNVISSSPGETGDIEDALLQLVASLGGSVSAEHGIGLLKTRWLALTRSRGEIEVMRGIKTALDPQGLLSPGRVLSQTEP